jgi:ribonucleoside-diphosphate reductase alpha chain
MQMLDLSPNAIAVLERRYLNRNEKGEIIESVEGMFTRVAQAIAKIDQVYGAQDKEVALLQEKFFQMMANLDFIPNSPTLMNAGLPLGQLSACFVLPVPDSMEGIFESVKNTALIHKSGGGTGFSFSRLRPKGSVVRSTGGVASGPVSFMKVFNAATEAVKQGGKRRGANMGILRVDHPDILEFIKCKEDKTELTNFNLSVGITEDFMGAVETGERFNLIDPVTKKSVDALDAREVFRLIVDKAWESGEPGIVFLDRINEASPVAHIGEIESTNPCGEQPLLPYESCNLGSINLARMVTRNKKGIDYDKLRETVHLAVHFLDNVIDANNYPLPEIEARTKESRKIGLGVMGFADLLILLGIPYNSEEAVRVAEKIMEFIDRESKKASQDLAKTRGTFPGYKGSSWERKNMPLRNATTTTIAPTGTISMIAGCSSGIEPLFAVAYTKVCMDNDRLSEIHPVFAELAKEGGFYSERLLEQVIRQGSVQGIKEIPNDVRRIFVTTQDITPYWHVRIQAAFQKFTDNGVSKTINFPADAQPKDIEESFTLAYKLGCKGITVYRDGSREGQVLNAGGSEQEKSVKAKHSLASGTISPRKRPEITQGMTEKAIAGCGNLYITVNYDSSGICEVFTNLGKGGGCPSQTEATSRLVSLALRSGISADSVIEQLKGIRCPSTLSKKSKGENVRVLSCPDAIARTLEKVMNIAVNESNGHNLDEIAEEIEKMYIKKERAKRNECPECGGKLEYEGGCVLCRSCGYSKCG